MGNTEYGKSIDIWSVGCIMAELINSEKTPMFQGKNPKDQLKKIFRIMGTPKISEIPQLEKYPKYEKWLEKMREYKPKDLKSFLPRQDDNSESLLKGMLDLNPEKRLTASQALENPWFDSARREFESLYN